MPFACVAAQKWVRFAKNATALVGAAKRFLKLRNEANQRKTPTESDAPSRGFFAVDV
jgi:hypothetical protein